MSIWPDVAIIDNKTGCKGCFTQRESSYENEDSGEINVSAICTWEQENCGCPTCLIFCGTKIKPTIINGKRINNAKTYEAVQAGVSSDVECSKWYLKESCETC